MGPKTDCDFLENEDDSTQRTIASQENENRAIREENGQLRDENAKLLEQVQALTAQENRKPKSEVRGRGELEHESLERKH